MLMLMLTTYEKEQFISNSDDFASFITKNKQLGSLFFKVMAIYLDKTVRDNKLQYSRLTEQVVNDEAMVKDYLASIMKQMANIAADENQFEERVYTTGQLAKYFGVSVTTVNNWIENGRFINYKREGENKQARISGDIFWRARTGKIYSVQEIVDEYELENKEMPNQYDTDESAFLIHRVAELKQKYGGTLEETLKNKSLTQMTTSEESDLSMWNYLLKRLQDVREK